jgi:hypothetical protein
MRVILAVLCVVAACGDDGGRHIADAGPAAITVSPPDLQVTVVDGVAVLQSYTAHTTNAKGDDVDITAGATFTFSATAFGTFAGADATISGQGAGPVRVVATYNDLQGDTGLTVFVKQKVVDPTAPPNAPDLFGNAVEDPSLAPAFVYPSDHILVPPNLGQFDVHWNGNTANTDNLFEVKMANQYVDVRLYTTGLDMTNPQPFWTVYSPDTWYPLASTKQTLSLSLAGMDSANPGTKGTAATVQSVDVTNENAQGGIYYWTTQPNPAIVRYDVSKPNTPPAPFFSAATQPATGCVGCHTLSRDGTKIAMTLNGAESSVAAIYDVATQLPVAVDPNGAETWDFAAFNPSATKLFTIEQDGVMNLRNLDGTLAAATPFAPMTTGSRITQPEVSPDATKLVTVEFASGADYYAQDGQIVIWDYNDTANTVANPRVLVATDAANGVQNYYPSFSPDSQWIAFTRTSGYSYNNNTAEIWVIKADGTQPPIQLGTSDTATTDLTNSWARWVPFGQTFGASNEPMFYLTFSSQRPFGVRIPSGGRPQIWMTPFFPARASLGQDPSGNAFRVPFQAVDTSNHIAQWTNAVVIQ